jgi:hypothetical protein
MIRLLSAGIVLVTLVACGCGGSRGSLSVTNPAALFLSKSTLTFNGRLGTPNPPAQSVGVLDTGTAGFSFTASSDSAWLTVTPTSGSDGDSLHISVAVGTLASGSYTGHITVNAIAFGSPGTVTVTFVISS